MNNERNDKWEKSRRVWYLLSEGFNLPLAEFHEEPLAEYQSLLRQWNRVSDLLSDRDLAEGIDAHVADSWSLLPYCFPTTPKTLLDVGSGGGFPGIPLAIAAAQLRVTLLERKERKVAFLRRVTLALDLGNATPVLGMFPEAMDPAKVDFMTSRAIEKPARLRSSIARYVEGGTTYLSQSRLAMPENERFLTEPVDDVFSREGLRRSRLWIVRPGL